MEQQAAATRAISAAMHQAGGSVGRIDGSDPEIAAAVDRASRSTHDVRQDLASLDAR